jgi:hypothetical protein
MSGPVLLNVFIFYICYAVEKLYGYEILQSYYDIMADFFSTYLSPLVVA